MPRVRNPHLRWRVLTYDEIRWRHLRNPHLRLRITEIRWRHVKDPHIGDRDLVFSNISKDPHIEMGSKIFIGSQQAHTVTVKGEIGRLSTRLSRTCLTINAIVNRVLINTICAFALFAYQFCFHQYVALLVCFLYIHL